MAFEDFFGQDDFLIDPEDLESATDVTAGGESWDTGSIPDIFASGECQDIFSTKMG